MATKIKLFALLVLVSSFANAQDKKEAFKKAVDFCNCRIAESYCKQYSQMKPESAEKKSYDKINYIFKCSISNSLSYDSLDNILKQNNFSEFSKKSSAVMNRILKEDVESFETEEAVSKIISGIYESQEFKNFFLQYSEVGFLKETLNKELMYYLSSSFTTYNGSPTSNSNTELNKPETELQKEVSRLQTMIEENKISPFAINWLSIILMVVLSGAIFLILKLRLTDLEERTDRHRKELDSIDNKKTGNNFTSPTFQNSSFNDFKKSAERNISDLNSAITSLQSDVARLNMRLHGNFDSPQSFSSHASQVEKQQRVETLYAPIPNRDGTFTATNVTGIENPSSSFYKFTITDSLSQRATFEFLNVERAIKDATSSPELILNPVCKIKNALNQNAKKIRTVKPGTVVKQNDKWIVDKPAEIEYE
jgi:hypothetical protein